MPRDAALTVETASYGTGNDLNNTITGNAAANFLLGDLGSDSIMGRDGNDIIYGDNTNPSQFVQQSHVIYGGNGDDEIRTALLDVGSIVDGGAGAETININDATASGGDGNDTLTGSGAEFTLYGNSGDDTIRLFGAGGADGGEGSDLYVKSIYNGNVTIQDIVTSGVDSLIFQNISDQSQIYFESDNNGDLYVTSQSDAVDKQFD